MKTKIPYGKQNITIEDIETVSESLKGEFLTQGDSVNSFEKSLVRMLIQNIL